MLMNMLDSDRDGYVRNAPLGTIDHQVHLWPDSWVGRSATFSALAYKESVQATDKLGPPLMEGRPSV